MARLEKKLLSVLVSGLSVKPDLSATTTEDAYRNLIDRVLERWNQSAELQDRNAKPLLRLVSPDHQLHDLAHKDDLKIHVKDCHLLVLLAKHDNDEEIAWELGLADAHGKPVIVCSPQRQLNSLIWKDCLQFVLPQTGEQLNDLADDEEVTKNLLYLLEVSVNRIRQTEAISRKGEYSVQAYADRGRANVEGFVRGASRNIDILTTNMAFFRHALLTPGPSGRTLLAEKLEDDKVLVRLLVMDPDSVIAQYRARQLGMATDVRGYREELRESIYAFYSAFQRLYGDRFTIKVYEDLPLQITIRVDQELLTSFVTRGGRSRDRVHVRFKTLDEGVYDTFVSHFGSVYDSARDIREFHWISTMLANASSDSLVPSHAADVQPG